LAQAQSARYSPIIQLINGFPQGPNGFIVSNGSIKLQLNVDATVIAAPGGFVCADIPVVFQFNAAGQIQPNAPAIAAKIWSNAELNPQLSSTLLGTYYLVTFYDQNGAVLNATPLWWQFPEAANATVDISQMTPVSTVGGNVIFYPTNFLGGTGTVTSVTFTGDGILDSSTPSAAVTTSGTLTATPLTQNANYILAGPTTGSATTPTFRRLVSADIAGLTGSPGWDQITSAAANLTLNNTGFTTTFNQTSSVTWTWANITAATSGANQSSPIVDLAGTYWNGASSNTDGWTIQDVVGTGVNPTSVLTFTHSGSGGGVSIQFNNSIFALNGQFGGSVNATGGFGNPVSSGAFSTLFAATELLTLSLASIHTDTSTNLLPATAIIDAVAIFITQTISGGSNPTTIAIGDAGTSNRFLSTGTPLTAGSSAVGLNQIDAGASSQAAAAKVRVTLDQIPGQGIVRIVVFYRQFNAPTS
jgi:hypothetical protein